MLARWVSERINYSFGGRSWPLLFTHRALLFCEEATGRDTLNSNLVNPPASLLRGLLYGLLKAAGAACTLEDVGRQFRPATILTIRQSILKAWIASMADPEREPYRPPSTSTKPPEPHTWIKKWAWETSRDGLGVLEDRWLDMTPRMIQELTILQLRRHQREEYLNGIIASQIENYSAVHPKKVSQPQDFMIHPFDPNEMDDEAMSVGDKIARYYAQFPSRGDAGEAPPPEARIPIITGAIPQEHLHAA